MPTIKFLIIFLFFASCQEVKDSSIQDDFAFVVGKLIKADNKILQGRWLRQSYIDSVKAYQSFNKAFSVFGKESLMTFLFESPPENQLVISDLHEGASYSFLLRDGGGLDVLYNSKSGRVIFGQIFLSTSNMDTLLNFKKNDSSEALVFSKLNGDMNSLLISGSYNVYNGVTDTLISTAYFQEDIVEGFSNYTKFSLVFDFNDDIPQYDIIRLGNSMGKFEPFAWKMKNHEIVIYGWEKETVDPNFENKKWGCQIPFSQNSVAQYCS